MSAMLIWLLDHDYIEAAMVSGVEDDDAWKAKPVLVHNRDEVLATAGSRYTYCANPLALRQANGGRAQPARARRHGLPDVVAADDVGPQGRQGVQAVRVQHRLAVLEDVRRRHLHRAVRGEVRPAQVRDGQDEHQGRVPDLDDATARTTRSTSRSATPGPARAASAAPTSPPSTPTSPSAASARTTTGR